jgi:TolC family type I secretion outer membrane protein
LILGLLLVPAAVGAQAPATSPIPRPATPEGIRAFPTPAQVVGREITLEEAVAIALENQPQILARLGDLEAAKARVDQAFSAMLPQLSTLGFSNHGYSREVTDLSPGSSTSSDYSWRPGGRLALSQRLYDFGKTSAATAEARAQAESARERVETDRDRVALAVKEFYFNLLFAKRLVSVQEAALERADLNLRSARGFFEVGTRPKSDVTRAEVDVANARVDLIRARNAVALARTALNTFMGIAVNHPTEVKDILAYERLAFDVSSLVDEAFRRRPEYRTARFETEAAEAAVRRAYRDFFPEVFGVGTVGGSHTRLTTGEDVSTNAYDWEVGVELRWSIFDGGNKIARHTEAKATLEATRARVREVELQIWREVEDAYVDVVAAEARIGAALKGVESAQENFRLSQGRFDAGVGTIIELTDAQLALTRAQNVEAQALADYRISVARLERAIGRR